MCQPLASRTHPGLVVCVHLMLPAAALLFFQGEGSILCHRVSLLIGSSAFIDSYRRQLSLIHSFFCCVGKGRGGGPGQKQLACRAYHWLAQKQTVKLKVMELDVLETARPHKSQQIDVNFGNESSYLAC